ncbi:TfoX/Sxy family protein [Oceaniglobus trochenteri]|uniref:TfoX/Sxy family protein n=1 Tax=Oceaniglobus trochenteri TaxID=2763260 RepID=UPI001CFFED8F
MASQQGTVDFIVGQMAGAGTVSARPMFGEYGVYCEGKFIGVICNDRLFVKPTAAGRAHGVDLPEKPAYEGAKPSLAVPEDRVEDADWLAGLIRATWGDLPAPRAKKKKA